MNIDSIFSMKMAMIINNYINGWKNIAENMMMSNQLFRFYFDDLGKCCPIGNTIKFACETLVFVYVLCDRMQ